MPILIASALLLLCHCAKAQSIIHITQGDIKTDVLPQALCFEDKSGNMQLTDVQHAGSFQSLSKTYIQKGFTNAAVWVKFIVANNENTAQTRLLEINNKELDSVVLYENSRAGGHIYTAGDFINDKSENFFHIFNLQLPAKDTLTYFLRVTSSSALHFNATMWKEMSYMKYLNIHDKFLWLFIGILFIRLIYVLVLSRFIREKPFTIYTVVIFILFTGVIANAVNLKTLGISPVAANYLLNCYYIIIPMGLAMWVSNILKKYNHPNRIIFRFIYATGIAGLVAGFFLYNKSAYVMACNLYLQAVLVYLIIKCTALLLKRKTVPIIYLVPGMFLIFNQLHYSLINLNVYPFTQLTLILISSLFSTEVITMSLLLGNILKRSYRINLETMERLQNVRNKISADLHDELGSVLTQISLQSDMVNSGIYSEEEKQKELENISATSRQALHAMSDIVWSVKAGHEKIGNLIDRMKDHADIMLQPTGATAQFETNGLDENKEIDNHLRQELFFIYKEAITNIVKHSHPANVRVRIDNTSGRFEMEIINDINQAKTNTVPGGNGILNMKKRAANIGAVLETVKDKNQFTVKLRRQSI